MTRGYAAIGLVEPKFNSNVGGAVRAAFNYGASLIVVSGNRYKRERSDTVKAYRHIPLIVVEDLMESIPFDCVPIAVELKRGAKPITEFNHPERAMYIFGPEDGTLSRKVTDRCKHTVFIPTRRCMNLAATVNVVLFDRAMKRSEWPSD